MGKHHATSKVEIEAMRGRAQRQACQRQSSRPEQSKASEESHKHFEQGKGTWSSLSGVTIGVELLPTTISRDICQNDTRQLRSDICRTSPEPDGTARNTAVTGSALNSPRSNHRAT